MKSTGLVEIIIYGYSNEKIELEIDNKAAPLEKTRILNDALKNIYAYLTSNLKLGNNNIYIFVEKHFRLLKNFAFRSMKQLDKEIPLIVVFTDINLKFHPDAQNRIFSDLKIDYEVHDKDPFKDNGIEQSQIKEDKKEFVITRGIGTIPLEDIDGNPFIYSTAKKAGPFCFATPDIKDKDKLIPPIYFDDEYIQENYNYSDRMSESNELKLFRENKKGELILTDKAAIKRSNGIFKDVVKKLAVAIIKGHGIVRMSLPVRIFDKKTQLEKYSEFFNCAESMNDAVESNKPIDRLKNLICMFVSNFFYGISAQKPFNPYLGETFQGEYSNGSKLYIEHVTHDPPTDYFLLINEKLNFKIHGRLILSPKMKMNEIFIGFKGLVTCEIGGEKIFFDMPQVVNTGLVTGDRKLKLRDYSVFYYPSAQLKGYVRFGSVKENSRADTLTGGIYKQKERVDVDEHNIRKLLFPKLDKKGWNETPVSVITGSWIYSLKFDGKEFWNRNKQCHRIQMNPDPLPSDWRFREDLLWLIYGDQKQADAWKLKLEAVQRHFRKLRVDNEKAKKKKNHAMLGFGATPLARNSPKNT